MTDPKRNWTKTVHRKRARLDLELIQTHIIVSSQAKAMGLLKDSAHCARRHRPNVLHPSRQHQAPQSTPLKNPTKTHKFDFLHVLPSMSQVNHERTYTPPICNYITLNA